MLDKNGDDQLEDIPVITTLDEIKRMNDVNLYAGVDVEKVNESFKQDAERHRISHTEHTATALRGRAIGNSN